MEYQSRWPNKTYLVNLSNISFVSVIQLVFCFRSQTTGEVGPNAVVAAALRQHDGGVGVRQPRVRERRKYGGAEPAGRGLTRHQRAVLKPGVISCLTSRGRHLAVHQLFTSPMTTWICGSACVGPNSYCEHFIFVIYFYLFIHTVIYVDIFTNISLFIYLF